MSSTARLPLKQLVSAHGTIAALALLGLTACGTTPSSAPAAPQIKTFEFLSRATPESIAALREQAESGDAHAQYVLAVAYEYGRGVPQDTAAALSWYTKSSERSYCPAQLTLARKYYTGDDVERDKARAHGWYERLAKKDVLDAVHAMERRYRYGEGVEADRALTRYWEDRARELASKGMDDAAARRALDDPAAACNLHSPPALSAAPPERSGMRLEGHRSWVVDLDFSRDGKSLYSASHDEEEILVWDTRSGAQRSKVIVPGDPLMIAAHGERVLVRVPGKQAVAGRITRGRFEQQSKRGERIRSVCCKVPAGLNLDSSTIEKIETPEGIIYRHSRTGTRLASMPPGPGQWPSGVAISPDVRRMIYSTYTDGQATLYVWDIANSREEQRIALRYPVWLMDAAYTPDGRYLATSGNGLSDSGITSYRNIRMWEVEGMREVRGFVADDGFVGMASVLSFSPDGKTLAAVATRAAYGSAAVYLFNVATGRELARYAPPDGSGVSFTKLVFSADGKQLAAAHGYEIYLYSLADLGRKP
jgi:hypothetical protein